MYGNRQNGGRRKWKSTVIEVAALRLIIWAIDIIKMVLEVGSYYQMLSILYLKFEINVTVLEFVRLWLQPRLQFYVPHGVGSQEVKAAGAQ
jgi:hypothetical protein